MSKKQIIYYSGNELLADDSMPFKIVPKLKMLFPEIDFAHHDPSENLPEGNKDNIYDLIIIDTVTGIDKVITIENIDQLASDPVYSPHDWDLGLNLKLLIKLGKVKKFLIIGVPGYGDIDKVVNDVLPIIKSITLPIVIPVPKGA